MMAYHSHQGSPWTHGQSYMPTMGPAMPSIQGPPQMAPQPQQQTRPTGSPGHRPSMYKLVVMQQPAQAKAANGKDKDRKPVDPPPILQLSVNEDPDGVYRQSPYLIAVAYLEYADSNHGQDSTPPANMMSGTMVSSLHRLKDPSNKEGAFFIFGDLTIKSEGTYRIRFDLLQMEFGDEGDSLVTITTVTSNPFPVQTGKAFPGMAESTFITRSFSDQGVRLRLRKDSRALATRKRNLRTAERLEQTKSATTSTHGSGSQNGGISQIDDRSYYDPGFHGSEPSFKKNRAGAGLMSSGTPTPPEATGDIRWASYNASGQPFSAQGPMGAVTTGPPTSSAMMAPPGRIDTHFSSLHHGQPLFSGPSSGERLSPINHSPMHQSPVQFSSSGAQSSSPHAYMYSGGSGNTNATAGHLASMGPHTHSAMNTPTLQSPRSHAPINGTISTGSVSPGGPNMYTTAPSASGSHHLHHNQGHQAQYSHTTPYQGVSNAFDQSTIRENGIPTPLTGSMPADTMSGGSYSETYSFKADQSA